MLSLPRGLIIILLVYILTLMIRLDVAFILQLSEQVKGFYNYVLQTLNSCNACSKAILQK